ncbi:phage tail tape measure protein [Afifella sp. YEN Y35]|uniref:phage tail tape measure protein n=1 Tax=Afifella sp. YEN Y35 TaxID=3388337 RepID=UPI0039DFA3D4
MARLSSEVILKLSDRVSGPARRASSSLDRFESRARKAQMGLARGSALTTKMGAAMGVAAANMAATAGPLAAGFAGVETVKTAAAFESQLVQIAKKGGLSADALAKVKSEILGIVESGRVAMSPLEIAQAYERGIAAGLPVAQMKEFVILSAQAADAWDMSGEATGNAFAGFQQSLGLAIKDARRFADLINTLADSGISDESDIVDFVDRSGAQLKMLGLTNEQIAAYGASLLNLKMPAEVASRAMNTLSTKLLTPKATKASRKAFAQLYGDADSFTELLKEDANEAVQDFLKRLSKLDKFKRAELLTNILGQGFSDEVNRLIAALPELERNLDITVTPRLYAGSLEAGYQKKLDTLEAKWAIFKANLEKLKIDLGDLIIGPGGDFLGDARRAVNETSDAIKALQNTWNALQTAMGRRPEGDFDKKGVTAADIVDPLGNARRRKAELLQAQRMRELADKTPSAPAVGAFGARDMGGVVAGNVLAGVTNEIRRARSDTHGEQARREYQRNAVTYRDAERQSMQALKEEFGRYLMPDGQAISPRTDTQDLVDEALEEFAGVVLTTTAAIAKATGTPATTAEVTKRAGLPTGHGPNLPQARPQDLPRPRPQTIEIDADSEPFKAKASAVEDQATRLEARRIVPVDADVSRAMQKLSALENRIAALGNHMDAAVERVSRRVERNLQRALDDDLAGLQVDREYSVG